MELIKININKIKPYDKNCRKNDAAVDVVMRSIEQCQYIAPIILDEDNIILAGHTRFKALKKLGYKEVECIIKTGLSEEQKKKYRLLDNKTAEIAEWDFELLKEELAGLDFGDLELDWGIHFDTDIVSSTEEAEEDDYNIQIPKEPIASYGQIYKLGRHRLMCGDSTKKEDVEKLMGNLKADLLITDPPYNVNYKGKTEEELTIANDSLSDAQFAEFLLNSLDSANEYLKKGGVFYIWHADSEGYNFRKTCRKVGWKIRECLIWNKNAFVLGRQDYHWKHEPCLYGWKDGASHFWGGDRKQSTVLDFDKPQRNGEHPTMKPVKLFDYQIRNSSKEGDIVLDLFGGSGTTLIACEQNNRVAYIMEYDPKYVDVIIDRWETLTGQKAELLQ